MTQPVQDCWSTIGIHGDNSCPELTRVIHCRNCPVFISAGRTLLEQDLPAEYRRQWTSLLAAPKEPDDDDADTISALVFRIDEDWLALPTNCCREAHDIRRIHGIPHRRSRILQGLVNIRGELELCIAADLLMGIERTTPNPLAGGKPQRHARLLVIERQRERWVFAVDMIHGVMHFASKELGNVPVTLAKAAQNFVRGIFDRDDLQHGEAHQIGLLDEERLFAAIRSNVL